MKKLLTLITLIIVAVSTSSCKLKDAAKGLENGSCAFSNNFQSNDSENGNDNNGNNDHNGNCSNSNNNNTTGTNTNGFVAPNDSATLGQAVYHACAASAGKVELCKKGVSMNTLFSGTATGLSTFNVQGAGSIVCFNATGAASSIYKVNTSGVVSAATTTECPSN